MDVIKLLHNNNIYFDEELNLHNPKQYTLQELIFIFIGVCGVLILNTSLFDLYIISPNIHLIISLSMILVGVICRQYVLMDQVHRFGGIVHAQREAHSQGGLVGIIITIYLSLLYILLYFYPNILGQNMNGLANTGMVHLFDSMSLAFKGTPANQWFMYGVLYTFLTTLFGFKYILKYYSQNYLRVRTYSIMFFQLVFAFLIPEILEGLNQDTPYFAKDLKNAWPLNYYFFEDWHLNAMINPQSGNLGLFYLVWGIALSFIIAPLLTWQFGKRWYCSWVCGCGGLAETAGDSYRSLSDKSKKAWKIEKYLIYSVLIFICIDTMVVLYGYFSNQSSFLGLDIFSVFRKPYGFLIGALFSGVVGVGFYPIFGNRVWCRFGCPMAAYLGLMQKYFSKFQIKSNGDQCISCGNCSTYCEMGIDVRAYAQQGQDFTRASCVGCGICAAVCPRGVLQLTTSGKK